MRGKLSRDQWLAVGLFVVMLALIVLTVLQEQRERELPPLTSFSNQPDGARALYLWLEALGYTPDNRSGALYTIPDEAILILLLEPLLPPQEAELRLLENWVEDGGILLLAGRALAAQQTMAYFEVRTRFRAAVETADFHPTSPLWQSPPLTDWPDWSPSVYLDSEREDVAVQGVVNGRPVLLSLPLGEGQIWLASDPTIFTNEGLQQPGSAELAQNLVSLIGPDGLIWFDDWHRGIRPQETGVVDLNDWLRRTPMGQAILLLAAILFVGLLLQGRPFGPPVPLPGESRRRAPLEYITAIANLSRRAGHTQAIAQDYQQRLKRHLASRYRLNPNLPHAEFVEQLAAYDPNLDANALLSLLNQLSQPRLSEAELVRLATAVARWTEGEKH
jgi:hypothetical protein